MSVKRNETLNKRNRVLMEADHSARIGVTMNNGSPLFNAPFAMLIHKPVIIFAGDGEAVLFTGFIIAFQIIMKTDNALGTM